MEGLSLLIALVSAAENALVFSIPSLAGAPSRSTQLGLNPARRSGQRGRILESLEHETAVREDKPQLEAFAALVAPDLVEHTVR